MDNTEPAQHVIVIDGTQSRQETGSETNAGIVFKLVSETCRGENCTLWYDPGVQGHGLWNWVTLASGWGINKTIENAYQHLSQKYRPGDRIFLFGFSRGAYAVRSLAGMIERIGLLKADKNTPDLLHDAYCMYEKRAPKAAIVKFSKVNCHTNVDIEMVGVWDTVKALGLPYPGLSYLAPMATDFHDANIGNAVRHGYHALALDEDRRAFKPVMWQAPKNWTGVLEQMWFKGAHADVGGHVWSHPHARPLSNIPLVWMLEKAQACGLILPKNWHLRFPCDANVPAVGNTTGIARFFLFRRPRAVGRLPSEALHPTVSNPERPNP